MSTRYFFHSLLAIPLLPIMYFQGKRIRKSIPKLPEATEPSGFVQNDASKSLTLLCLGESTMAGVGVNTHEEGFAGSLARELAPLVGASIDWHVLARSGYTAKNVTHKLVPKIEITPDIIAISLGGNDAFTFNSSKQWGKDIQSLIDSIREKYPNVRIVFTNMPPIKAFPAFTWTIRFVIGGLVEILGDTLAKVAQRNKEVYYSSEIMDLDIWSERYDVKEDKSAFFSDGIHPSMLTYQVWAKDFARFLIRNSKKGFRPLKLLIS